MREIFQRPCRPYTQLLIASLLSTKAKGYFTGIPGLPPLLLDVPPGCVFHTRCPIAIDDTYGVLSHTSDLTERFVIFCGKIRNGSAYHTCIGFEGRKA